MITDINSNPADKEYYNFTTISKIYEDKTYIMDLSSIIIKENIKYPHQNSILFVRFRNDFDFYDKHFRKNGKDLRCKIKDHEYTT